MKTILAATDFSPAANNAAEYALELAKYFSAKLILLNTYPLPPANYDTGLPTQIIADLHKASEDGLASLKSSFVKMAKGGLDIECLSVMGSINDVVEEVTKANKVDLVVMGIVGEAGKIKEHIIGSTAVKAARHLRVPLFIIPEGVRYKRIHKLSFACDMDHTEETTIIYMAKYFTKLFDAELEIINIEDPSIERSEEKASSIEYVEERLHKVNHKTFLLSEKDAAAGLEEHYNNYPSDVIMLNPKKHNIFQTLFAASVTKKLIFHSKLPLLIIH